MTSAAAMVDLRLLLHSSSFIRRMNSHRFGCRTPTEQFQRLWNPTDMKDKYNVESYNERKSKSNHKVVALLLYYNAGAGRFSCA